MAAKKFKALLEPMGQSGPALGWTIVRVPFVPSEVWPKMIRLRVSGSVNGFEFRTSLFPMGGGGYFLLVNKAMQKGAGVSRGEMAEFRLEADLEPRMVELPDELAVLLADEPGLREWYDSLSEHWRRAIGKEVMTPTSDGARMRKAEQMAERLLATMEGEKELPPMIAMAFRRRPKVKVGWEMMTVTQRRAALMAVFSYQSPEAREKRVGKLCDEAEKRA